MAAVRTPAFRCAFGNHVNLLRGTQRRWARVHDVRFLVTHQQQDAITERYKAKLNQKAKENGLRDAEELKAVYQEKIRQERRKTNEASPSTTSSPPKVSSQPSSTSPFPAPPPPPEVPPSVASPNPSAPPGIKLLSSFIDIPKTLELPQKEIEYIWRLRHASDPQSLCAIIPRDIYNRMEATARRHPQFILPLPREGQGAEIHFLQWTFPTPTTTSVLFTHLAEFKLRGEYAQPHTTVTHHLDLREPKGLVLLQGSVVDGRGITVDEGKWLLMCLQKFYGGEEKVERKKLLEQFSQGDGGFQIEELLEEAEKVI